VDTASVARHPHEDSSVVFGVVCNGAAALVAIAAALAAARRRRRDLARGVSEAQVLHLPGAALTRDERRAA
jgi:hypothetical protein